MPSWSQQICANRAHRLKAAGEGKECASLVMINAGEMNGKNLERQQSAHIPAHGLQNMYWINRHYKLLVLKITILESFRFHPSRSAFPNGRCGAYVDVIPQSDEVQLRASGKTTPVDLHVFPNVSAGGLWGAKLKNRSPPSKKKAWHRRNHMNFWNSTAKNALKYYAHVIC